MDWPNGAASFRDATHKISGQGMQLHPYRQTSTEIVTSGPDGLTLRLSLFWHDNHIDEYATACVMHFSQRRSIIKYAQGTDCK